MPRAHSDLIDSERRSISLFCRILLTRTGSHFAAKCSGIATIFLCFSVLFAFGPATALADGSRRIAMVYNFGPIGKLDKSFNEAAYRGVLASNEKHAIEIAEYEPQTVQEQSDFLLDALSNNDMTIVVGFGLAADVERLAPQFPEKRMAAIDFQSDLLNVQSFLFREEEGAYLVGLAAGLVTNTRVVGFVGGRDMPLIHKFRRAYHAGVLEAAPDAQVLWQMSGITHKAFSNPVVGMRIAEEMIEDDADILFAAAGSTGLGVYQAAKDFGVLAIGVDSNQNYLYPGTMLTSMIKRVDRAVEIAVDQFLGAEWRPGTVVLGLKEGGVDYAIDRFNEPLLHQGIQVRLETAQEAIVRGDIDVAESMALLPE